MTAALAENRLWYFIVPQVSSTEVVHAPWRPSAHSTESVHRSSLHVAFPIGYSLTALLVARGLVADGTDRPRLPGKGCFGTNGLAALWDRTPAPPQVRQ